MRIIGVHALQPLLATGQTVLLDVRGDDEFSYAAIAGSVHIPLPELPRRVGELNPARPIAVLCPHGMRSEMAARWLEQNGFTDVSNVAGGGSMHGRCTWTRRCHATETNKPIP